MNSIHPCYVCFWHHIEIRRVWWPQGAFNPRCLTCCCGVVKKPAMAAERWCVVVLWLPWLKALTPWCSMMPIRQTASRAACWCMVVECTGFQPLILGGPLNKTYCGPPHMQTVKRLGLPAPLKYKNITARQQMGLFRKLMMDVFHYS